MATIKIPKTPASAYNHDRSASDLLRAHVQNLEIAVRGPRTKSVVTDTMTEAEAARYIRELARQLHHQTLLPDVEPAPTVGQRPEHRRKPAHARKSPGGSRKRGSARKRSAQARHARKGRR